MVGESQPASEDDGGELMPVITFICTECDEGCVVACARAEGDEERLPALYCEPGGYVKRAIKEGSDGEARWKKY